jgi:hypothetical protein
MPMKRELELTDFPGLVDMLKIVSENAYSTSLEADQARSLIGDCKVLSVIHKDNWDDPALNGKTVGESQTDLLRIKMADFLYATHDRWGMAIAHVPGRLGQSEFYGRTCGLVARRTI